ncbi:DUF535 family protein [Allorhizobium sonneratiae]|uniref:DUF535 family protein n=1 Tax=Allorhizobium sonneratiae TaxID=2934936 RepID=UPI002034A752|nr:DUF535 family protein [Allorhizobium sonneratiae]
MTNNIHAAPSFIPPGKKKTGIGVLMAPVRMFLRKALYKKSIEETSDLFSKKPYSIIKSHFPNIETKPLRRSFYRKANTKSRYTVLNQHYRLFSSYFPDSILIAAHTSEILIAEKNYKDNNFAIYLCRQDGFGREAELRVKLVFNQQIIVQMGMTFIDRKNLGFSESGHALWLGIIKSSVPGEAGKELFRNFTKAFEGLRPKYIHVILAQSLASALNIQEIYAPSYLGQAVSSSRRFKQRVHADYDGFWEECGGEKLNDFLYRLPRERQVRDLSDYKSKKRAQAKKRQEIENDLRNEIIEKFQDIKRRS